MGESKSARCDDLESLKKRKCSEAKIENPRGSVTINKNKPVTDRSKESTKLKPEQITQIQPQKLSLLLRSGKYSVCLSNHVRLMVLLLLAWTTNPDWNVIYVL